MNRKTSIIILTYNHLDLTKDCIESIRKYTKKGTYQIIVVDNASTDDTKKYLQKQKDILKIYNKENKGFPIGCNQGIQLSSKENDILLLNNDTIVTTNWLSNLKTCLYSNARIGAVGAVSNHTENRQGVNFVYDDFATMQQKAKENNVSNSDRWEEKIFLIGFCLLIKREVLNKIGLLDEKYTPGYIEDNDLSLRIIKSGYKLMLCHDVFIHHYLGTAFRKNLDTFYPILYKNREYFYKKWHFETFAFDDIKSASFPLMEEYKTILDLNASIGVNLLEIQYRYKNSCVDGIEKDSSKRKWAKKFAKIYKSLEEVQENYYDCILIGNRLETEKNPNSFLKNIKKYLKEEGVIIGEFENAASIKRIKELLYETNTKEKNLFTKQEMVQLLEKNGYKELLFYHWYDYNLNEEESIQRLIDNYPNTRFTYYSFRAKK